MSMTTLGIDIAKNVFHVHGRDAAGRPVFQKRFSRVALIKFMANLSRCRVGMEVCGGANYWSRTFQVGEECQCRRSVHELMREALPSWLLYFRPSPFVITVQPFSPNDLRVIHRLVCNTLQITSKLSADYHLTCL